MQVLRYLLAQNNKHLSSTSLQLRKEIEESNIISQQYILYICLFCLVERAV